ncbi:MAG: hypothetical protein EXR75_05015 [Myxococcales bacterium]|nr:hypothetical protein [Myxococcales bacterium]
MAAAIESHGDIEIFCQSIGDVGPSKAARLVFRPYVAGIPPYQVRVRAPSGKVILERVMRELPTGEAQSVPPITFTVQAGKYEISVKQLSGGAEGTASLTVR